MKNVFMLWGFLAAFGIFGFFIDGDGAGGSDTKEDEHDKFDVPIKEEVEKEVEKEVKEEKKYPQSDEIAKRLEDAEQKLLEMEEQKTVQNEIKKLSKKHKGFDSQKVKEKLEEIAKTDSDLAEMYNNPIGWENLWINDLAPKKVENDQPEYGRNVDPVERRDEILQKVQSGGIASLDEKASVLGKYL